jgi:dCMP deaminase
VLYVYGLDAKDRTTPVNAEPCKLCKRVIINTGISKVIYNTPNGVKRKWVSSWVKKANEDPFEGLI